MERLGFIHDELDIKILILYVLRALPSEVSFQNLSDLVLIDDGFDYFQYSQCLSDLVDSGHVEKNTDGEYKITKKGVEHCEASLSRLPYSVRTKADKTTKPTVDKMRRDALISTAHEVGENGCMVKLSVSDDVGPMLKLEMLTSDEERAAVMEQYFRKNAEHIYNKLTALLSDESEKKGK